MGQFLPAMDQLKTTYESLGQATRHVAEGFERADASVSLS